MLEHFHACHDIEASWLFLSQRFDAHFPILDTACPSFKRVKLSYLERLAGKVDTQNIRTPPSHRISQDTAATANIQHTK